MQAPLRFPEGLFLSLSRFNVPLSLCYDAAMIRLIINADDLGSGPGRDKGIVWAFRTGLISSASLLANGPTFHKAARQALIYAIPVGVHLNLSEGCPLTGPIQGLTNNLGQFPGKYRLRALLDRPLAAPDMVYKELCAQVTRVIEAGLTPDHLDTHQHFFLFPQLTEMVLDLAEQFAIKAVRLPIPSETLENIPSSLLGHELALYQRLIPGVRKQMERHGVIYPSGLWGMSLLNNLSETSLIHLIEEIPEGTWELMVHPGYPDLDSPFSGPERLKELKALASPRIRKLLKTRNIQKTTFRDLTCAS